MTVGEMMERMSAAEYSGWQAMAKIEPMAGYRADIQSAVVAETVYNMNRGKGSPAKSLKDFMPVQKDQERWLKELTPQSMEEELIQHFKALNRTRKK